MAVPNFRLNDFGRVQEPAQVAPVSQAPSLQPLAQISQENIKEFDKWSKLSKTLFSTAIEAGVTIKSEYDKQTQLRQKYDEEIQAVVNNPNLDPAQTEEALRKQQKVLQDQGVYQAYENLYAISNNGKHRANLQVEYLQGLLEQSVAGNDSNVAPGLQTVPEETFAQIVEQNKGKVIGTDSYGNDVTFGGDAASDIAELVMLSYGFTAAENVYKEAVQQARNARMIAGLDVQQVSEVSFAMDQLGAIDLEQSEYDPVQKHFEKFYDLGGKNLNANFFEGVENYLEGILANPNITSEEVETTLRSIDNLFVAKIAPNIPLVSPNSENERKLKQLQGKFIKEKNDLDKARAEKVIADKENSQEAIVQNYMRAALQLQRQGVLTPEMVRKIKTQALQRYIQLDGRDVDTFVTKFDNTLDFLAEQEEPEEGVYETLTYELEVAPTPTEETRKSILEALQNQEITVPQFDNLMERWNTKSNVSQETDIDVIGKWDFKPESYITPAEEVLRMNNKKVPIYNNLGQIAGQATEGAEDDILPPNQISNINKAAVAMQRAALEGGEYAPDFAMFTVEEIQKLQEMGYDLDLIEYAIPEELPSVNFEGVVTDAPSIETRKNIVKDVTRRYSTYVALRYALKKKAALDKLKAITG